MHDLWQAKLAAWIHDPAEKALVLLRDPAGHEGRTVRKLRALLFGSEQLSDALRAIVRRADHWASGADRPEFPRERPRVYWEQTRFTREPILIHPISGRQYDLRDLQKIPHELASEISFKHLERWIVRDADGHTDHRRTLLCLWRFGPEPPSDSLGLLWSLLPADTRLPDHTIWDHLRLCSAFAGAMAADSGGVPALLSVSLGPVQSFIAQSRSTSDLWASSHLLSRLGWEAMRVVCERFGPDAIVLPDLRGVPIVDRWLAGELEGIEPAEEAFARMPWRQRTSDANPLFAAALPNRFLAIVPAAALEETARAIGEAVRAWLHDRARAAFERVLEKAYGSAEDHTEVGFAQIEAQLAGLPELVWSGCDWSLLEVDDRGAVSSTEPLRRALAAFYPPEDADAPGWLGSEARRAIEAAGREGDDTGNRPFFYRPRPGVYYGALHELTERAVVAAKAIRPFEQRPQQGVRCSLCGEREWLTTDREHLLRVGRGGDGGVWERIARNAHTFVREGERLCALCCLKRLWPRLWNDELRSELGEGLRRYVVSTHTMALAPTLRSLVRRADELTSAELDKLAGHCDVEERAALPHALVRELDDAGNRQLSDLVRRLPAQLDALDDEIRAGDAAAERQRAQLVGALEALTGTRPEVYYAFVLFDGDRMGALLSGTGEGRRPRYADLWHPKIRDEVRARFAERPE
ncbi:MAG: type III-B CRISPR-associated protein Cas10/Cmr2, partial [Planctomycetota bacterium]